MARTSPDASDGTEGESTVRRNWLRAMYAANIAVSGPIGLATLAAPDATRQLLGIPAGDPVNFGIASGAVPLAFGLAGLMGLRFPIRLSPVLALQVVYKSLFLAGVVLPMAVTGTVPDYSVPVIGIFAFFVVGNLVAIPFPYLLERSPELA